MNGHGILVIPESLRPTSVGGAFEQAMIRAMMEPITDPGDASSVLPYIVYGDAAKIGHVTADAAVDVRWADLV